MRLEERVFDAGLQAERTALAWRRTALAIAVATVGIARFAIPGIGSPAAVVAGASLVLAASVGVGAWRRYRLVHRCLTRDRSLIAARRGGPLLLLAFSAATVALLALAVVLRRSVA